MKLKLSLLGAVLASVAGSAAPAEQGHPAIDGSPQARTAIYVTSFNSDSVLRFDADTGAFIGVFVPPGSGGLNGPTGLAFGPDGNLYVASFALTNNVLKYDGRSGAFLIRHGRERRPPGAARPRVRAGWRPLRREQLCRRGLPL